MPYVGVGRENSGSIDLHYEDHGAGKPVVLIHGWPLSGASWEKQLPVLLAAGCRVITYDRRGFGRSSQPSSGYEYDTFAQDLRTLVIKLDLRDAALVGFSMGAGEVARYLGKYGADRVDRAAFLAPVPPFLLKTPDNPEGVERALFDGIIAAIAKDRPAFLSAFLANFYNVDVLKEDRVSDEVVRLSWRIAADASPIGTLECVRAWLTDFRLDLARIDVPTLVMQGAADRILPIAATGRRLARAIDGCRFIELEGAPHGLIWTHADDVNHALLDFLRQPAAVSRVGAGAPVRH